jgi:thioredoxin-like negative regulator of GroEL
MSGLMFLALCGTAWGAGDADSYAAAHQTTMETGKPMVVMVSTEWCAPCQMMKKTVIPQVRKRGLLRKVAFAMVNPDRDRELADQLTGGGPVPQLVMYCKTRDGWTRQVLVGGQTVEAVEQFIKGGVASTDTDAAAEKAKSAATEKEKPAKAAKS